MYNRKNTRGNKKSSATIASRDIYVKFQAGCHLIHVDVITSWSEKHEKIWNYVKNALPLQHHNRN